MGFLDMTPEQADSMLNFGIGLLAASGPSSRPVGFGQVLASGLHNMQQGSELARKNKMEQEQLDLMKSYRTLQEQQIRSDMQNKSQQQAMQKRLMESLPGLISGQPQQAGYWLNPNPDSNNVRLDPNAENDIFKAAGKLEQKAKMGGKLTPDEQMLLDQVKSRIQPRYAQSQPNHMNTAQLGVTAGVLGLKGGEQLMQLAKMQQPDWQSVDSGGQIQFINKNSGQIPTINKSMSPDAIAANQLGWFNANKPTFHDGALVYPDGSVTKTPMYAPPKGSQEATAQSSAKVLPLLDQAENILKSGATGSYIGAAADEVGRAFGASTKGAQLGAQLKALEGAIMMAQPRMEGPQSDKDVQLYRQLAGQIGDSTVPAETRMAAIQGIRKLHQTYAGTPAGIQPGSGGGLDLQAIAAAELKRRGK